MLTLEIIKAKLAKRFEGDTISSLCQIPHPFELQNTQEGASLVFQAMQHNQHILIVGDYDADGILSTAIMVQFFRLIAYPHFSYVIPDRFSDGYGISIALLERFPQADLIITVDNGITAIETAQFCKEKGKTLIITDHHTPKDILPQALIINPKVSGFIQEDICGALVAWYFCAAIKIYAQLELNLTPLLELVGIACVSDMMPLKNLNRTILKKSLSLFKNPSFAFSAFLRKHYTEIDEECIAFYIAPLLNASGRMAQADIALSFILSQTQEEALNHFQTLRALNTERKKIQEHTLIEVKHNLMISSHCVLACGEGWHEGILGILAGKLVQDYQKTAFVLTFKDGIYQGSGRAFGNTHLIQSLESLNIPIEFGGHKGAIGIKLHPNDIQTFLQNFKAITEEDQEEEHIFGELPPQLLTNDLLSLLKSFSPYGEGNPKPLFTLPPLPILSQKLIGKEKNHTLLTLQSPTSKPIKAIAFFCTEFEADFHSLTFYITQDSFSSSPMLVVQT